LALDDFGTGYSALGYLKRFPFDIVKVDRSFVSGLGEDHGDSAIVGAVLGMANALGMQVVAEGIETERQLACLNELGASLGQGFYFAAPGPV
jgi:EAL domain-containing protein (putative c-di-GMP-specific phosphodiesterase class I)